LGFPLLFEEGKGRSLRRKFMVLKRTQRRRELRHNSTSAEKLFWSIVSRKQFRNLKFRRQHHIGIYIVDFYCPQQKLIIEIDGDSHFTQAGKNWDEQRTAYLKLQGYWLLRYNNLDVVGNIDGVFEDIAKRIDKHGTLP
jgi:very-short-patch-repair endonuclease